MSSKTISLSDLVEKTLGGLSPIQTIMKMAEERNIRRMGLDPEDVISFGGGWCNHKTPDELRRIYRDIASNSDEFHKSGRYSPIKGSYSCRVQLCRFENKIFDINNLEPSNIILGHSSTQLFHDVVRVLLNPGDSIGFLDPTYANYENAAKCALREVDFRYMPALNPERWSYLSNPDFSLKKLEKFCKQGLKTLVIPIPDNPTSQIPEDGFVKSCYEIMEEHNGFLILDHAYKTIWFNDKPKSFSWSPKKYPNLITLHSNSKWLSSLGRRIGWVEADKGIIDNLEKINESTLLSPDTLHSMTTAAFLKETLEDNSLKEYIEQTRRLYQDTAEVMIKAIKKKLGWKHLTPQGGLYTCSPTPNNEDSVDFVQKILKNTGVLLIPGNGFGPSMEKAVRLSYGPLCHDHELIKEGIERISDFLEKN
ncbi:MAG: pyridoxal phosphate-dependent aminotransferase [Candidatus Thermoplasmatota archaeon]